MAVRIKLDGVNKILAKRGLDPQGKVQRFFTNEVARLSDPYVPFKTGALKNFQRTVLINQIQYNAPYAEKQYRNNKGLGKQGTSNGGLRGKYWDKRMWADRGKDITESVAKMAGGRGR